MSRAEEIAAVALELAQRDPCRCEPWVFTAEATRIVDARRDEQA